MDALAKLTKRKEERKEGKEKEEREEGRENKFLLLSKLLHSRGNDK